MKISQKQAELLAKRVVAKLKSKKSNRVSDLTKAKIETFVEKRRELQRINDEAQQELNKHDNSLWKIIGNIRHVYAYDSVSKIVEKVEQKLIPSEQDVADEIILNAMFTEQGDLEKFLETVSKKFEAKLQNKIATN